MSELCHYGTPRHSGRYPWGSGENPYQHGSDFLRVKRDLEKQGFGEKEIAEYMGMTIRQMREQSTIALAEEKGQLYLQIQRLYDEGYSKSAIARELGKNESVIRNYLDPMKESRVNKLNNTVSVLKDATDNKRFIDISEGSEAWIGVSRDQLKSAARKLIEEEGYKQYKVKIKQLGTGNETTMTVLAAPDVTWQEMQDNKFNVEMITDVKLEDHGRTIRGLESPTSVDSSRVKIVYAEEGGVNQDGLIEIRRGVEDLSLGNADYAQVRIAVDGTHYLKGMAVYADDLPEGIDIRFNTNKHLGTPMLGEDKNNSVLKPLKDDPDNPFGSSLRTDAGVIVGQRHYIDADGNDQLSPVNIVRMEGDWNTWSKTLSAQFLSKQYSSTAKQQLDITYQKHQDEFDELNSLTNPEVKQHLLLEFANQCDRDAVHLSAAALPRQSSKVLIPLTDIPDDQIYAPTYNDGEKVALIRYPHGGTFEIPVLTVNKRIEQGKERIGQGIDAVGISAKVAQQLSGADFDGDTVTIIPIQNVNLKATGRIKELIDFDPKEAYPAVPGMKVMTKADTQKQMGIISNLITDMTIGGATEDELVRATKHSMVVIDAEKHKLNYKLSELDNRIQDLKDKYQGGGGASTLISQSKSELRVPERKDRGFDKETGEKKYEYTDRTYKTVKTEAINKDTGELKYVTKSQLKSGKWTPYVDPDTGKKHYQESGKEKKAETLTTKMAEAKTREDIEKLSTGTVIERIYGDYAYRMKTMANNARKAAAAVEHTKYDPEAAKTYSGEVARLNAAINIAEKNRPLERKAQALANSWVNVRKQDNPSIEYDEDAYTKLKNQTLMEARNRVGASSKNSLITITDREWEAIQAGALSSTKISKILDNSDKNRLRNLATPSTKKEVSSSTISRIQSLYNSGATLAEIADKVGMSVTSVYKYLD